MGGRPLKILFFSNPASKSNKAPIRQLPCEIWGPICCILGAQKPQKDLRLSNIVSTTISVQTSILYLQVNIKSNKKPSPLNNFLLLWMFCPHENVRKIADVYSQEIATCAIIILYISVKQLLWQQGKLSINGCLFCYKICSNPHFPHFYIKWQTSSFIL